MKSNRWRNGLGSLLAVVLLGAAAAYVAGHWEELGKLGRLNAGQLTAIYAISLAGTLVSGRMFQCILRGLGTSASFLDMVLLQNAATLAGLVPFKGGAVMRAVYLRRRYGMELPRLGLFLVLFAVLTVAISSLLAAIAVAFAPQVPAAGKRALVLVLAALFAVTLAVVFVPLPSRLVERLGWLRLRQAAELRRELLTRSAHWVQPAALMVVHFLLVALRLAIIYHGLGLAVGAAGALALAALGNAATLLALTPGAMGVRELALGGGAVALGIPMEVGLLVGLVERAINVSWALVAGLPSTYWLLRRARAGSALPPSGDQQALPTAAGQAGPRQQRVEGVEQASGAQDAEQARAEPGDEVAVQREEEGDRSLG